MIIVIIIIIVITIIVIIIIRLQRAVNDAPDAKKMSLMIRTLYSL